MIRSRAFGVVLFSILFAFDSAAQVELPKVHEIVEVRVVELDLIVTDRQGNRVGGLLAADFEILEDGKLQTITNFSEVVEPQASERPRGIDPGAPAPMDRVRRFVFFVDTLTTHPFQRKRLCTAAAEFLDKNLRPGDEAMLIRWNRHLKVVVAPTGDLSRLREGLKEVSQESSIGPGSAYWYEQLLGDAEERRRARQHARAIANDVQQSVHAINTVLARLSGVEGRKILVLVTEGLAMAPGLELLDAASSGDESEARNFLESEELHSGPLINSIARTANAAGVTVYAIHGAGLAAGMSVMTTSSEASRAREKAIENSVESLKLLANSTGGLVAANSNDFGAAFDRVARDLSSYYSLGYRTTSQRVDRERKLEVRSRIPQYTVRARRSFVERSAETEINDQVIANLFLPVASNQMGIAVAAGTPKTIRKNRVKIPIDVKIPMSSLAFSPAGDSYLAELSIFIASAGENDRLSKVRQLKHQIRLPRNEFGKTGSMHYTYGLDLDLETTSKENRISLAILDNLSTVTGFAALLVETK